MSRGRGVLFNPPNFLPALKESYWHKKHECIFCHRLRPMIQLSIGLDEWKFLDQKCRRRHGWFYKGSVHFFSKKMWRIFTKVDVKMSFTLSRLIISLKIDCNQISSTSNVGRYGCVYYALFLIVGRRWWTFLWRPKICEIAVW